MDLGGKRQKIRRHVSLGDCVQEAAVLKHEIMLARDSRWLRLHSIHGLNNPKDLIQKKINNTQAEKTY